MQQVLIALLVLKGQTRFPDENLNATLWPSINLTYYLGISQLKVYRKICEVVITGIPGLRILLREVRASGEPFAKCFGDFIEEYIKAEETRLSLEAKVDELPAVRLAAEEPKPMSQVIYYCD